MIKNRIRVIAVVGAMAMFAGCGDDQSARGVEISPPAAELEFDEAFVKDRDIHLQMPEDVVLGDIHLGMVDSKDNLILVDSTQWMVFLTDAEGHYLQQIGTRGGAEGEYFYVLKVLLDSNGDLYIHTVGEGMKYLVFSGDSYTFKREIPDPNPQYVDHVVFTQGGNIYASEVYSDYALYSLDEHFNKTATFYPVQDQRTAMALFRYHNTVLTPKTGGGFYFMYPTSYKIHQYNEQGKLQQTLFSTYRSKHRDGIKPFPDDVNPKNWTPKHVQWIAEHIFPFQLFECDPDLLVLTQLNSKINGEWKSYLNILYKDGHSVADGIRVPDNYSLLTVNGTELYFLVEGAFAEETGETSDPYVAVYRLNDREGVGKKAFSRSRDGQ